jgi:hypothetical protein
LTIAEIGKDFAMAWSYKQDYKGPIVVPMSAKIIIYDIPSSGCSWRYGAFYSTTELDRHGDNKKSVNLTERENKARPQLKLSEPKWSLSRLMFEADF